MDAVLLPVEKIVQNLAAFLEGGPRCPRKN